MKPLTRYAMGTGMNVEPHMAPWPEGKFYRVDQVDARIAELEAEVVEWRGQRDQWAGLCVTMERRVKQLDNEAQDYSDRLEKGEFLDQAKNDRIHRLQTKCAELEAERDEARADAERYRWLNNPNNGLAATYLLRYGLVQPQELDAAIDAARGME